MIADERTLAAGVPVRRAAWQQGGRALLLGMAERRCAIRDRVALEDYAAVAVLSADFGVSAVTIRSDLGILEKQGAVRRVHGGAVRVTVRATRFQQLPEERYGPQAGWTRSGWALEPRDMAPRA